MIPERFNACAFSSLNFAMAFSTFMTDGAVSPHEGLTQTQETQVFEDTQVMEETEEGEIDVNLEGRVTQVVEGG